MEDITKSFIDADWQVFEAARLDKYRNVITERLNSGKFPREAVYKNVLDLAKDSYYNDSYLPATAEETFGNMVVVASLLQQDDLISQEQKNFFLGEIDKELKVNIPAQETENARLYQEHINAQEAAIKQFQSRTAWRRIVDFASRNNHPDFSYMSTEQLQNYVAGSGNVKR